MDNSKGNYFYIIPAVLVEAGDLTKAVLYGAITSLVNTEGFCWASNEYLAKKIGRKNKSIISKYLSELQNEGWIIIELNKGIGNKRKIWLRGIMKKQKTYNEKTEEGYNEKTEESSITESNINKYIAPPFGDASVKIEKSPKRSENEPVNIQEFTDSMRKSKRGALHLIAEWAETIRPNFSTYGQWQVFMKRNLRPATELEVFTKEQIDKAYSQINEDSKDGEKFKPTLETIIKYLTK